MVGFQFRVITEHSSLKWLCNLRNSTARPARWSVELHKYDFKIVHCKGTLHLVLDALSKMSEKDELPASSAIEQVDIQFGESTDLRYKKRFQSVMERPLIFSDWRIEHSKLHRHRPNEVFDRLVLDLEA